MATSSLPTIPTTNTTSQKKFSYQGSLTLPLLPARPPPYHPSSLRHATSQLSLQSSEWPAGSHTSLLGAAGRVPPLPHRLRCRPGESGPVELFRIGTWVKNQGRWAITSRIRDPASVDRPGFIGPNRGFPSTSYVATPTATYGTPSTTTTCVEFRLEGAAHWCGRRWLVGSWKEGKGLGWEDWVVEAWWREGRVGRIGGWRMVAGPGEGKAGGQTPANSVSWALGLSFWCVLDGWMVG